MADAGASSEDISLDLANLNKEFGNFVDLSLEQDSDLKEFFEITRLLLLKTDLLYKDTKFLQLVSVTKDVCPNLTTTLTPKNVISSILQVLLHSIKSVDSNQDDLRNVLNLLELILSLGPDLPPIDRYFESGAKSGVVKYNPLLKSVTEFTKLFQTDEFLNGISNDVIKIYNTAIELIGGEKCKEMVFETCRFIRGYDPHMRHFDTPIANLFKIPISLISSDDVMDPTHTALILRLIAASPSLFIDLDESPQPKLKILISHLHHLRLHLPVCLAMTSCLYRLFLVSEQTLDACLDDDIITPLMEEFAFLIKTFRNQEEEGFGKLLGMVFEVLNCIASRLESKIIISGQPSIILECTSLIHDCVFESIFAVRFLASLSEFLSVDSIAIIARGIFHCTQKVEMKPELSDYFNYVTLQLLAIQGLDDSEVPDNRIGSKEFVDIVSNCILQLSQQCVLKYSMKVVRSFLDYSKINDVITKEFISALTRLFLESVSKDAVELIDLFSFLFCHRVMTGSSEAMALILASDLTPQIVKLFLSEERCEYLSQYSKVLKSIVIGYEKADLEYSQLKDKALVDKMTGLIIGKYFTIQEHTPPEVLTSIKTDVISNLWSFSLDSSYVADVFTPSHAIAHLLQALRVHMESVDLMVVDTYQFRAIAHVLSNIGLKKEMYRLDMAETGIHKETYQLLTQLLEYDPVPWSLLDATLRFTDILTSDEILKLELVDYGYLETLTRIISLQPDSDAMVRVLDSLNSCAYISPEIKQRICSVEVLELCAELVRGTRVGRLFCISCGLLTTLADTQDLARMVSNLGIFPQLLSTPRDEDLVVSCSQVGRWALNLFDKVVLNSATFDDLVTSSKGEKIELRDLESSDGNFIVHRMMGMIRQGCMNCEGKGDSCTQSESLSTEELCFYPGSLSLSQYQRLVNRGWYRRGGDRLYRWDVKLRESCLDWETRLRVKEFSFRQRKTFQRIMKRIPNNLTIDTVPARFSEEGYSLYNEYNLLKHDKPRVSKQSYIEHVVDTCVPALLSDDVQYGTFHQEYRVAGELIAIGVIDIIPEGVISIYFYFKMRHDVMKLSLGTYSSLREIELVRELSSRSDRIQFYYLQGWNGSNRKLSYKSDYSPMQFLSACVSPHWRDEPTLPHAEGAHFSAREVDYVSWQSQSPPLDNKSIRVWIDGVLITFQQLLSVAKLDTDILKSVSSCLDQLCYAVGPELTSQLVLVYHTSTAALTQSDI